MASVRQPQIACNSFDDAPAFARRRRRRLAQAVKMQIRERLAESDEVGAEGLREGALGIPPPVAALC